MEFASQLESIGLWHWSIFVLLHLNVVSEYNKEDAAVRKASVCEGICLTILKDN